MTGFQKVVGRGITSLLQTLLGLVAGFCVYISAATLVGDKWLLNWIVAILLSPVFGFVAVLIHEAGHAIAAWRCKWIVERIVVWPVAYAPRTKAWSRAPGWASRGDMFGWVATHPGPGGGSRKQETLILFGGVVANMLSAGICLLLANIMSASPVTIFLGAFALFSIVMAVANISPWKIAGQPSDGLQLWRLWRRPVRRSAKGRGSQWNAPRKW